MRPWKSETSWRLWQLFHNNFGFPKSPTISLDLFKFFLRPINKTSRVIKDDHMTIESLNTLGGPTGTNILHSLMTFLQFCNEYSEF